MTGTDFRYVTYIAATPEQVWDALTKPEISREFWHYENHSDWKAGSIWEHKEPNGGDARMTGIVIKHDRPHQLLMTWADPRDAANLGAHSRVHFQLEGLNGLTKLTLLHDNLTPASSMFRTMDDAWPRILSGLKSYLETGQVLPAFERIEDAERRDRDRDGIDDRFDRRDDREDERMRAARVEEVSREMDRRAEMTRESRRHSDPRPAARR